MKPFYLLLIVLLSGIAETLSARPKKDATAEEFSNMAREIRVTRRTKERLEDYQRYLEYAVNQQNFTPQERKNIQASLNRLKQKIRKAEKKGKMTVNEEREIYRELSSLYQKVWYYRHNGEGKKQKIIFFNREIVLREQYAKSTDFKTMSEIIRCVHRANQVREQLKDTDITPGQKKRIERECFTVLSEYFTFAETPQAQPAQIK